jgi:hypothetical protein
MHTKFWLEKLKGRDHLDSLDTDERAVITWIRIWWKEVKVVQTQINIICRKYKVANKACLKNLISQPSLEISCIWIPLIHEEACRLQDSSL